MAKFATVLSAVAIHVIERQKRKRPFTAAGAPTAVVVYDLPFARLMPRLAVLRDALTILLVPRLLACRHALTIDCVVILRILACAGLASVLEAIRRIGLTVKFS